MICTLIYLNHHTNGLLDPTNPDKTKIVIFRVKDPGGIKSHLSCLSVRRSLIRCRNGKSSSIYLNLSGTPD